MRQKLALYWALITDAVLLSLIGYWFVAMEPERVFLVNHLGAGPLDLITRGRYWMAGLVACGYVLILSVLGMGILGLIRPARNRGARVVWNRLWLLAVPIPLICTPFVILRYSLAPVPVIDALGCTLLILCGTGLTAVAAALAYADLRVLTRHALASAGIVPILVLTRALELPGQGLISPALAVGTFVLSLVIPPAWALLLRSGCRRMGTCSSPWPLYVGALTEAYVLAPVLHHLLLTPPGYPYITAADNLVASHWWLQVLALTLGLAEAMLVNRIINARKPVGT